MIERNGPAYLPDYAVLPGDTLQETLESLGMSQADLAQRTGLTPKTINEIIKGKNPITADTALQFERVLGVPANFWTNLERNYQEAKARLREQESLEAKVAWLKEIPVRAMVKMGWITEHAGQTQQLLAVLSYFGVTSPERWKERWTGPQVAFRQSPAFTANPGSVAAWLRQGELQAQKAQCQPFDRDRFRQALDTIRRMTTQRIEEFRPAMERLCADAGVAVVFVPEIEGTVTSGATMWLSPDKAMIVLSLRHKKNDYFWFTFFHEAAHVLKHGRKEVFIEGERAGASGDEQEQEADRFAQDILIPPGAYRSFAASRPRSKGEVRRFAQRMAIAPGIVVGRLQHEGVLPRSHMNDLKIAFTWAEVAREGA